jgi:hypothetical protein
MVVRFKTNELGIVENLYKVKMFLQKGLQPIVTPSTDCNTTAWLSLLQKEELKEERKRTQHQFSHSYY